MKLPMNVSPTLLPIDGEGRDDGDGEEDWELSLAISRGYQWRRSDEKEQDESERVID